MLIDEQGKWLHNVNKVLSPNYDQRPQGVSIDLLVLHSISLPPGEFGGNFIDRLFTNCLDPDDHPCFKEIASSRVSAHILIDRQGVLTQYVPFNCRAWHAGRSEFRGRKHCNDYSIGIELEGCDNKEFTQAQYQALAELTTAITDYWPAITKDRIVGHCHIAPDRKTDPGPLFNWDNFYQLLEPLAV